MRYIIPTLLLVVALSACTSNTKQTPQYDAITGAAPYSSHSIHQIK